MRSTALICSLVVVLALSSAAPSVVSAANGQPFGCGSGWGGYYPFYGYNRGQQQYIPYFALHPPVYYSQPVPRPYGYSPFAYPPGTMTPDVPQVTSEITINPFVPRKATTDNTADKTAEAEPLRIRNPYYYGEKDSSVARISLRKE